MCFIGIKLNLYTLLASIVEAASTYSQVPELCRVGIWAEDGREAGLVLKLDMCSYGSELES